MVIEPVALPAADGANVVVTVAVSDGFKVAGAVKPLTENPVPLTVTAEIFTDALPLLVTVNCCLPLLPVATVPKLRLDELALSCPVAAAEPVPVNGTVTVGLFGSLLVMAMLPVAAPVAVGAKVTTACADCPALSVLGVVIPLIVNSEPVTAITDTVRFPDPVLLNVRLAVPVSPFDTVPKAMEAGDTESCGCEAATAVAERLTTAGELPLSPVTVIVPVTVPAAVGFTATETLPDFPAANAIGKVTPDRLN